MTDHDHRPYSIPLFSLGAILLLAGLIGLVVDALSDLDTNNPGGVAAVGAILLFAGIVVATLLNPLSTLGAATARSVSGAGAFAVVVILVAALAGGAALGAAETEGDLGAAGAGLPGAGDAAATAQGLLGSEDFTASLSGASAPGPLAMLGGAGSPSATHDLAVPASARNLRAEVHWDPAATGGADTLELRIETADGEVLESASGGPGLSVDLTGIESDAELRIVVSLPSGSASTGQDYDAYVSYFESSIPASFTAHEA